MARALTAAVIVLAAAPPAAAAQTPKPEDVAPRCTSGGIDERFQAREQARVRRIAVCALAAARRARSARLRTEQDPAVARAARAALDLAVRLDQATDENRSRVTRRVLARFACRGSEGARVMLADTSPAGAAETPLALVRAVLSSARLHGTAPLLGRRTRLAVVVRPGRVLAGQASGAVAIAVVGATCRE